MTAQGFDLDQSLATKFQSLLEATTVVTTTRQPRHPAAPASYAPSTAYTAAELQAMSLVELHNVLHSLGLSSVGSLPKWQLVAHALMKQEEQQQQQHHTLFTEPELKSMAFSELERIALHLNIQDVSEYLHSEVVQLILATQLSLRDSPTTAPSTSQTNTFSARETYNSIDSSLLPSAPPAPSSVLPDSQPRATRSVAVGLAECGICTEPMGGGAARNMATPPCGHLYCYSCWIEVTQRAKRCPQCARKVSARDITKIYV